MAQLRRSWALPSLGLFWAALRAARPCRRGGTPHMLPSSFDAVLATRLAPSPSHRSHQCRTPRAGARPAHSHGLLQPLLPGRPCDHGCQLWGGWLGAGPRGRRLWHRHERGSMSCLPGRGVRGGRTAAAAPAHSRAAAGSTRRRAGACRTLHARRWRPPVCAAAWWKCTSCCFAAACWQRCWSTRGCRRCQATTGGSWWPRLCCRQPCLRRHHGYCLRALAGWWCACLLHAHACHRCHRRAVPRLARTAAGPARGLAMPLQPNAAALQLPAPQPCC